MISILRSRATFDLLPNGVAWVSTLDGRSGPELLGAGLEEAPDFRGDDVEALGKKSWLLGQGRADVVLRGPEVRLQRVDLPVVSRGEARRVAARKAQEIRAEDPSEGTLISTLIDSRPQGTTIWLVVAHRDVCEAVDFDLGLRGLRVDRLVPLALGLGGINQLLRPARSHGLTAVLWLDVTTGVCVVADRLGWLFDREIPLKYAGERLLRTEEADVAESEGEDQQVDRLATELKRTFAYVERELDLGEVVRVRLCGLVEDVDGLAKALSSKVGMEVKPVGTALKKKTEVSIPPEAGAALGTAMLPRRASAANLLPRATQRKRHASRARKPLIAALGLVGVLTFAFGSLGVLRYQLVRNELESVRSEASRWESEREGVQGQIALRSRAEKIRTASRALARPEPPWGAMLAVFGSVLPESLFVQRFEVGPVEGGWQMKVSLQGQAQQQAEVADAVRELRDRLEEHPLFRVISVRAENSSAPGSEWGSTLYGLTAWVAPVSLEDPSGG